MILFDTETTGLVGVEALPLDKQPRIIEICCVKLRDQDLVEIDMFDMLIDPGIPLPTEITRITGIKDADLKGKLPFVAHVETLAEFFCGERLLVAHNCAFDAKLLELELRRIGREFRFPWPAKRLCTVEVTMHLKGHRLKLGEAYTLLTGQELKGAHRAINDVRAMAECLRELVRQKKIKL